MGDAAVSPMMDGGSGDLGTEDLACIVELKNNFSFDAAFELTVEFDADDVMWS